MGDIMAYCKVPPSLPSFPCFLCASAHSRPSPLFYLAAPLTASTQSSCGGLARLPMFTTATASSPFLSVVSLPPPIAAVQNEKVVMGDLKLKPGTLAEMIKLIDDGTISSKIGKELLPSLLEVESLGPPAGPRPEDSCHCCSAALCD